MKRRDSLKAIALGAISTGLLVEACAPKKKEEKANAGSAAKIDRFAEEAANDERLQKETFFTAHEKATITVLVDIIIPKDEVSGSATEAGVPDFIEFIVKDMPYHQTPMRGGLRWIDQQCLRKYEKAFVDCTAQQQTEMIDAIAYPAKAAPDMKQGVSFFNLMRNLTVTGFYTSEMGVKDLGYMGNKPNQWNGVPKDVLDQYGLTYTEKDHKDCISFNSPE